MSDNNAALMALVDAVPDGRYAGCLNENDYAFFRLKLHDKGVKKGKRTIQVQSAESWLDGGYIAAHTGLYVGFRLKAVIGQFTAAMCDPMEARWVYADKLGECSRCGIKLTLQRSRELRIGSECEKHSPDYIAWVISRQPQLAHWVASSQPASSSFNYQGGPLVRPPARHLRKL